MHHPAVWPEFPADNELFYRHGGLAEDEVKALLVEPPSARPDLLQLHQQAGKVGSCIEVGGGFEAPGLGRGIGQWFPDFHRLLRRNQQPAEAGAVALVGDHFLAQGGEAAGACIAGTGQLDDQLRAKGSETAALLDAEGLPAFDGHHGGIGAQHGAIGRCVSGPAREGH